MPEGTVVCPSCKNEISSTSVFCNKCGYRLKEAPSSCPNCKCENLSSATFCSQCGMKLGEEEFRENPIKDNSIENKNKKYAKFFQPIQEINKIIKIFLLLWLLVNSFLLIYSYVIDPDIISFQETEIKTYYSEYRHKQILDISGCKKYQNTYDAKTSQYFPFPYLAVDYYEMGVAMVYEGSVDNSQYDYTEFSVYMILPLLLYLILYYLIPKRKNKPGKGRIFLPVVSFLLMLAVVFIFWGSPYLKKSKIVESIKSEVVIPDEFK